ncbi:BppU family phage baseplate upper protein [Enterococcus casseliflavus]|uniref:BppU family phage baseplate upper protein n=1 Tax=Enterococcus casseliflavus TaxID=37734 RepID=UPI001CA94E77|nr:BppU family phage baseplate upper protein [Enterococcus casseliflavus]MBZ0323088.1 BppU family phage baseplate upper protein [Enterococcus casseliflavus]
MVVSYPISLEVKEPNNDIGILRIRQSDEESQTLVVQLLEYGLKKSYEGLQIFFCAKLGQTSGLGIIEQKLLPSEMTDPKNGKFEYTMRAEDWQQLGRQTAYFSFRKMTDDHTYVQQFSTRDFTYEVTKNIYSDGIKEVTKDGSTYVWTFEDLLRLLQEFKDSGETDFLAWFDEIKDQLSEDAAGNLMLLYQSLRDKTGTDDDFRPFESNQSYMKRVYNENRERGVNVKWFGAKGDNQTDDTLAIKATIEYAMANNLKFVLMPAGDYWISSEIVVPTQIAILGVGSSATRIRTMTASINGFVINANVAKVSLAKLRVIAPIDNDYLNETSGILIKTSTSTSGTTNEAILSDVHVDYFKHGIRNEAILWNSKFENVRIRRCGYSWYNNAPSNLTITLINFYSDEPKYGGFYTSEGMQATMLSCSFGGRLDTPGKYIELNSNTQLTCIGCNFEGLLVSPNTGSVVVSGTSLLNLIGCANRRDQVDTTNGVDRAYFIDSKDSSKVSAVSTFCASGDNRVDPIILRGDSKMSSADNSLYNPVYAKTDGKITSTGAVNQEIKYVKSHEISLNGGSYKEVIHIPIKKGNIVDFRMIYINPSGDTTTTVWVLQNQVQLLRATTLTNQATNYVDIRSSSGFVKTTYDVNTPIFVQCDGNADKGKIVVFLGVVE